MLLPRVRRQRNCAWAGCCSSGCPAPCEQVGVCVTRWRRCLSDEGRACPNGVIEFGPFRLIAQERRLERAGQAVKVGSRALDLLIALAERAGEVVSKEELIARLWPDTTVEGSGIRVHVAALRKALGD